MVMATTNIIDSMTVEMPKEIKEGDLAGSLINPFIQGLLKTNKFFNPHYADECLDSVTSCRPDHCTTVTTMRRKKYTNCIGEIEPLMSRMTSTNWNLVKLDRVRVSIFSKIFLDQKKTTHFLSFCTVGPKTTFFISTNQYEGLTVNLELDTITLPTTYDNLHKTINEFDFMYDIVSLYQEFCVQTKDMVFNDTTSQSSLAYDCLLSICSLKTNSRKRSYSRTEQ
ncbi:uncharacterized protein B0P05DRAFT_573478 [Gilbertella persicaria]|uniref:uncharacterized protein n=1 Tax=Gilbertella persicaria TaxID=101096 RepID=UPI002220145F|nr:uncharacterized protein B0P05DRAFT_573478 [Gilbertella persicaria]KAI8069855.1 hypothetical protein B0P05DRAFT_573478 [Gilbertella persicaria]